MSSSIVLPSRHRKSFKVSTPSEMRRTRNVLSSRSNSLRKTRSTGLRQLKRQSRSSGARSVRKKRKTNSWSRKQDSSSCRLMIVSLSSRCSPSTKPRTPPILRRSVPKLPSNASCSKWSSSSPKRWCSSKTSWTDLELAPSPPSLTCRSLSTPMNVDHA